MPANGPRPAGGLQDLRFLHMARQLECILACEQAAQRFYADNASNLQDPALQALFRALAAKEARHAAVVGEALRLQRQVG